jgi:hypothetical protein
LFWDVIEGSQVSEMKSDDKQRGILAFIEDFVEEKGYLFTIEARP